MNADLSGAIEQLVRNAPKSWLEAVCTELQSWPTGTQAETMLHRLPPTYNGDLAYRVREILRLCGGVMSWEALGCAISSCALAHERWQAEQKVELLWAGPSPVSGMPTRRIDQVLYDLIAAAQREILLITFAAHKIQRLANALAVAVTRDVRVRLVLEFEAQSLSQLSQDALNAFPVNLRERAEIYYWPLAKREVNAHGRPGKLHAKAAVIDNQALLSSANLTDDAFLRNLELGALFCGGNIPDQVRQHFEHLITNGTLVRWKG